MYMYNCTYTDRFQLCVLNFMLPTYGPCFSEVTHMHVHAHRKTSQVCPLHCQKNLRFDTAVEKEGHENEGEEDISWNTSMSVSEKQKNWKQWN